jgi:hypothetical protein
VRLTGTNYQSAQGLRVLAADIEHISRLNPSSFVAVAIDNRVGCAATVSPDMFRDSHTARIALNGNDARMTEPLASR